MKFNVFSSGFWGLLLVMVGVLLMIRHVFNIDFPFFTFFFSILLIYIGIVVIRGGFARQRSEDFTMFSDTSMGYDPGRQRYAVLFGESQVDLRGMKLTEDKYLELNCVFGEMRTKLPADLSYEIFASAAFGSLVTPDGRDTNFGNYTYRSPGFTTTEPVLHITAKTVFGSMIVMA